MARYDVVRLDRFNRVVETIRPNLTEKDARQIVADARRIRYPEKFKMVPASKNNPHSKTQQFDVTIRVPARNAKEAREIVERSSGGRSNPASYGPVTIINDRIPLGVFDDRVYKVYPESGKVYGVPLKIVGTYDDMDAVYSRLTSLEWNRASESNRVVTVSDYVGRAIQLRYSPSDTLKLLYGKEAKTTATREKATPQYKGFYYARVSTPWGTKYAASRSQDALTNDDADFTRKTKEQLFQAIDDSL
jgi:hypothetical protein